MKVKRIHSQNLDAQEGIFFARELEHIKKELFEVEYDEIKNRALIPVSFEADPADEFITYYMFDKVGMAKVISDYASDIPRVDVQGSKHSATVRSLADSYGYSVQEIRASQKTGRSLDRRRADTAQEAIRQLENEITWFGDSAHNLQGILDHPNVPDITIPNGAAGTPEWSTKTPDEILSDLNLVANSVVSATRGRERADTLLLPIDQYTLIASTARSANSDTTILQYFLQNNPFIKNVDWLEELSGAGTAGADMMLVYKRDPKKLTLEIPQDFESFPPQEKGLAFEVNCHERCGGVIIYRPLSLAKAENI